MKRPVLHIPPLEAHARWAADYDRNANPLLSLEERIVAPMLGSILPEFFVTTPGPLLKQEGASTRQSDSPSCFREAQRLLSNSVVALDLACGTGRWLGHLTRRRIYAVGLDLSPEMLREARGKERLACRLIQADCTAIPFRSASADFAICSFGIGYIENLRLFAREVSRVIRGRGQLVLTDFHPSAQARGWKRSFRHKNAVVEVSHFVRPLDLITGVFAAAGFALVQCIEPQFAEPERSVFEQCGKGDLFAAASDAAAIFVCLFQRMPTRVSE